MAKRGRPRGSQKKKRKAVKVQFIERLHAGKVVECYEIAERIIKTERADLKDVKIGFAWKIGNRPDADGRLELGKCTRRKDLDRELDAYDFIILLNKDVWQVTLSDNKERLIFHELEHAQICTDRNGDVMKDDRGRIVTRIKKHDIEEFRSVVYKYGLGVDLSKLSQAAINDADRPLLPDPEKAAKTSMAAAVAKEEAGHEEKNQKAKGKRKNQKRVKDLK